MKSCKRSSDPDRIAVTAERIAYKKATKSAGNTFLNSILAGAFIAIAFVFYVTVTTGSETLPWGVSKCLGGLAFSLGLILVVICPGDLFTSSLLSVIPLATGKLKIRTALKNLSITYTGNFIGALGFAILIFLAGQHEAASGEWGINALKVASHKLHHTFLQAVVLGILCNFLVCLAVWMTFAAKSITDKIMALVLPVTMFVACGFEHCIANMFMVPMGILIKNFASPSFWLKAGKHAQEFNELTWGNFFSDNLLPVTIGNIIGGALLVGLPYWWIHLKENGNEDEKPVVKKCS